MLNTANKQPINVGILEISSQNKAILEYFFSEAGKSYFKEVSLDKAAAFIIDYDSMGAKESWESTFKDTNKPGIIISIKEVDLPSTIWLQKPLTVKALMEAGESIREIMTVETPEVAEITAEEIVDETKEEIAEVIEVQEIAQEEIIEEKSIEEHTIEENSVEEKSIEENSAEESNNEENIDLIDDLLVDTISEETITNNASVDEAIEENVVEEVVAVEEKSLLSEEIIMEEVKKPLVIEQQKEPELALTETNASASSTNFAASTDFVELDMSLEDSDKASEDISDATENESNNEIETKLTAPVDEPEIAKSNDSTGNNEVDSLLESLISGGENTEKVDTLLTDFTEDESELPSLDFDLVTTENAETIEATEEDSDSTSLALEDSQDTEKLGSESHSSTDISDDLVTTLDNLDTTEVVDDAAINQILQSDNSTKKPKEKSAEEELQSLLEEIRQEADGTAPASTSKGSAPNRAKRHAPTSAEERWKLTCGNFKDNTKLQKLCLLNPQEHILSLLIENIKKSKSTNEIVRIKFMGIIAVYDPKEDLVYCDQNIFTEFYANVCHEKIDKKKVKIHPLDTSEKRLYNKKMKEEDELTHSTEAFIWTTSLLTSKGRLPKKTNTNGKVSLSAWPDLTRLESIPNMMQIAALFHKDAWSLSEIIKKSGIAQKYIIAFYNAALALDMIENDGTAKSATLDLTSSKKNNNRSFFSKLLNKITA